MQALLNPTLQSGASLQADSAKSATGGPAPAYPPGPGINQYARNEPIYFPGEPATRVYLVVQGKVKILRHESQRVVVDIYGPDDLFGESVLAGHAHRMEQAVASEPARLMSWTYEEIEKHAASNAEFATALIRFAVGRALDFAGRIDSFSSDRIERRLTRALIRFAGRFGWEAGDGSVKMDAFTHEFLAQYIGTSREIVSQYMSRFRRAGYVEYSRNGIFLQQQALIAWQPESGLTFRKPTANGALEMI